MNKLIDAKDVATRDKKASVKAWMVEISALRVHQKKITVGWDGGAVNGDVSVNAFVNNGRVLARCGSCGSHEYVDEETRLFFCMECGNENSGQAYRVIFPDDWHEIKRALVARPIFPGPGLDEVQAMFRSKPVLPSLKRSWNGEALAELKEVNLRFKLGEQT